MSKCFNYSVCPYSIVANGVGPDEMPLYATFIRFYAVCQRSCLPVSRMTRVNNLFVAVFLGYNQYWPGVDQAG